MIWLPMLGAFFSLLGALIIGGVFAGVFALVHLHGAVYVVAVAAAVFAATFISIFFQIAVIFAASTRLNGTRPSISGSLGAAWSRRRIVAPWALVATIIGLVINALEQRSGIAGKAAGVLGGLAWAVATFFVLPVLAFEDLGPFKAVARSSSLLKERFGAVARTSIRFGLAYLGWFALSLAALVGGIALAVAVSPAFLFLAAAGLLGFMFVALLSSVVGLYVRTILYRYATNLPTPGIDLDFSQVFTKTR